MTLFDFDRSLELGPFSELCCVQQSAVFAGQKTNKSDSRPRPPPSAPYAVFPMISA